MLNAVIFILLSVITDYHANTNTLQLDRRKEVQASFGFYDRWRYCTRAHSV